MGKINIQLRKECHEAALHIQRNPAYAVELMERLPNYLKREDYCVSSDQYAIYMALYTLFSNHGAKKMLQVLHTTFIESIIIPSIHPFKPTIRQLDPHLQISIHFLMDIMMNTFNLTSPFIDFNRLIITTGSHLDIYLRQGNTPLIWSIANCNLMATHAFLKALEINKETVIIDIDKHCTDDCRGSALFLASLKGEMHRNIDRDILSDHPMERMDSVILKLLQSGASPLNQSDGMVRYSPLDIMIIRRSPQMVRLFLDHLPRPLTLKEIESMQQFLSIPYQSCHEIINGLAKPNTFPKQEDWIKNRLEIESILHGYKSIIDNQNLNSIQQIQDPQLSRLPSVTLENKEVVERDCLKNPIHQMSTSKLTLYRSRADAFDDQDQIESNLCSCTLL